MRSKTRIMLGEMRRRTLIGRSYFAGLLFVSPWIVGAALFLLFPVCRSLRLSVSEIEQLSTFDLKFVGFQWYYDAFAADVKFIPNLLSTSVDNLINLPLINIFALIVAMLLNQRIRCRGLFRSMFFLPVLLGTGFIMQQLLGQNVGEDAVSFARGLLLPPQLQAYLGPTAVELIQSFINRLTALMWNSGVQILIFLAALQSIPQSVYEAARVDSADGWECFWLVTLPMLAPMIQLNLVYTVLATFSMADNAVLEFIQWLAFNSGDAHGYEYSCAVSWIYCLFVLIVVGLLVLLTRRFVDNVKDRS